MTSRIVRSASYPYLEPHLFERGAAAEAERIRHRLLHLEVVVALADEELDRLAGGLDGGGELARLALELGRFQRAVPDDERRVELIEVALRAQLLFGLVVEFDVLAALGQPHRLQIVHAADEDRALESVARQAEIFFPVGDGNHSAQMRARGMAGEIDAVDRKSTRL